MPQAEFNAQELQTNSFSLFSLRKRNMNILQAITQAQAEFNAHNILLERKEAESTSYKLQEEFPETQTIRQYEICSLIS